MNPETVLREMQRLKPHLDTATIDPMLWMYMLKMADSFPADISVDNDELHKIARRLGEWLIQRIESVNDLNLKANYEKALACVEWFSIECGCQTALRVLSSDNDDPMQATKIALARSEDYARQYENRMGEEAFIYSELQEKLVHARTFIEEVNQMNRTLDALIEASKAADALAKVIKQLEDAATKLTAAAKAATEAADKLAAATAKTAAAPPVTNPPGSQAQ